jgi:hypothetical protein
VFRASPHRTCGAQHRRKATCIRLILNLAAHKRDRMIRTSVTSIPVRSTAPKGIGAAFAGLTPSGTVAIAARPATAATANPLFCHQWDERCATCLARDDANSHPAFNNWNFRLYRDFCSVQRTTAGSLSVFWKKFADGRIAIAHRSPRDVAG